MAAGWAYLAYDEIKLFCTAIDRPARVCLTGTLAHCKTGSVMPGKWCSGGGDADMLYLLTFIITLAQLRCNRLKISLVRLHQQYLQAARCSQDPSMRCGLQQGAGEWSHVPAGLQGTRGVRRNLGRKRYPLSLNPSTVCTRRYQLLLKYRPASTSTSTYIGAAAQISRTHSAR